MTNAEMQNFRFFPLEIAWYRQHQRDDDLPGELADLYRHKIPELEARAGACVECIQNAPIHIQKIMVLRYVHGMNWRQIAAVVHTSADSAQVSVYRYLRTTE